MEKTMMINELAVKVANGLEGAYEELYNVIDPLLSGHARKGYSVLEKEDLLQEFHIIAYKMTQKFVEKYHEGETSYMALVYTACTNFRLNKNKEQGRVKRSKFKETSLNADTNDASSDDKAKSLEENVSDMEAPSVEDQAVGEVTKEVILDLVEQFKAVSLRDYEIVKGLAIGLSNSDIAYVVNEYARKPRKREEVLYDQNTRKTISRARKNFRDFLFSKEMFV